MRYLDSSNPEVQRFSLTITTNPTRTGWTWTARSKWQSGHMRWLLAQLECHTKNRELWNSDVLHITDHISLSQNVRYVSSCVGLRGHPCSTKSCIWVVCHNYWSGWVGKALPVQISSSRNGTGLHIFFVSERPSNYPLYDSGIMIHNFPRICQFLMRWSQAAAPKVPSE